MPTNAENTGQGRRVGKRAQAQGQRETDKEVTGTQQRQRSPVAGASRGNPLWRLRRRPGGHHRARVTAARPTPQPCSRRRRARLRRGTPPWTPAASAAGASRRRDSRRRPPPEWRRRCRAQPPPAAESAPPPPPLPRPAPAARARGQWSAPAAGGGRRAACKRVSGERPAPRDGKAGPAKHGSGWRLRWRVALPASAGADISVGTRCGGGGVVPGARELCRAPRTPPRRTCPARHAKDIGARPHSALSIGLTKGPAREPDIDVRTQSVPRSGDLSTTTYVSLVAWARKRSRHSLDLHENIKVAAQDSRPDRVEGTCPVPHVHPFRTSSKLTRVNYMTYITRRARQIPMPKFSQCLL